MLKKYLLPLAAPPRSSGKCEPRPAPQVLGRGQDQGCLRGIPQGDAGFGSLPKGRHLFRPFHRPVNLKRVHPFHSGLAEWAKAPRVSECCGATFFWRVGTFENFGGYNGSAQNKEGKSLFCLSARMVLRASSLSSNLPMITRYQVS